MAPRHQSCSPAVRGLGRGHLSVLPLLGCAPPMAAHMQGEVELLPMPAGPACQPLAVPPTLPSPSLTWLCCFGHLGTPPNAETTASWRPGRFLKTGCTSSFRSFSTTPPQRGLPGQSVQKLRCSLSTPLPSSTFFFILIPKLLTHFTFPPAMHGGSTSLSILVVVRLFDYNNLS